LILKDINHIEKRLKAEKFVRWCIYIRNSYIRNMYKILALLKKKSEVCLSLANDEKCETIDDKLCAFCDKSRHTASSENCFIDATYRNITESQFLEINIKDQITNVLPLVKTRAKESWLCDTLCKIDDPFLIDRYEKFLHAMNTYTFKK